MSKPRRKYSLANKAESHFLDMHFSHIELLVFQKHQVLSFFFLVFSSNNKILLSLKLPDCTILYTVIKAANPVPVKI